MHKDSQQQTGGLPEPQAGSEEAQRGAVVHGRVCNVEREAGDTRVHENPKVVSEVGSGDAKRPHARENKDVSDEEDAGSRILHGVVLEDVEGRLVTQRLLVEVVPDDSEREDGDGEEVAAIARVAAEKLGEDSVVVFWW